MFKIGQKERLTPHFCALTLSYIDWKHALLFLLDGETHLWSRRIADSERSGQLLLHSAIAKLDTLLGQAGNHGFTRG